MWVLFALGSALFAGATAILAKCGIRKTDSTVATAIRTIVVLIMSLVMVLIVGSAGSITSISPKTRLFLVLSGLATGASWLCYYKVLRDGLASVVVPIDKLSILITIAFFYIFFGERLPKCRYGGGFVISFIDELNFAFDHPRREFVRSFSLCASSKADTVKSKPPQKSSRRFPHKKEHR